MTDAPQKTLPKTPKNQSGRLKKATPQTKGTTADKKTPAKQPQVQSKPEAMSPSAISDDDRLTNGVGEEGDEDQEQEQEQEEEESNEDPSNEEEQTERDPNEAAAGATEQVSFKPLGYFTQIETTTLYLVNSTSQLKDIDFSNCEIFDSPSGMYNER